MESAKEGNGGGVLRKAVHLSSFRTPLSCATLQQIRDTHAFIKSILQEYFNDHCHNIKILYGGSVKPANAEQIFELDLVDGGLIGGASLDVTSFKKLCTIASFGSI